MIVTGGGGRRFVGRVQGERNRETTSTRTKSRNHRYEPRLGTAFVHAIIDDHSRVAYAEICADEKADTAIGVLERAVAWFADRGVTVELLLLDNGSAYKSYAWRDACADLGITPKKTRLYRPQANGRIERFRRTLADGWSYARFYSSEAERRAAFPGWLHLYNHHRHHSAIGAPDRLGRAVAGAGAVEEREDGDGALFQGRQCLRSSVRPVGTLVLVSLMTFCKKCFPAFLSGHRYAALLHW